MEVEMGGAYDTYGKEEIGIGVKTSVRKPQGKRSSAVNVGRLEDNNKMDYKCDWRMWTGIIWLKF